MQISEIFGYFDNLAIIFKIFNFASHVFSNAQLYALDLLVRGSSCSKTRLQLLMNL
jgi:hypothetical protein